MLWMNAVEINANLLDKSAARPNFMAARRLQLTLLAGSLPSVWTSAQRMTLQNSLRFLWKDIVFSALKYLKPVAIRVHVIADTTA